VSGSADHDCGGSSVEHRRTDGLDVGTRAERSDARRLASGLPLPHIAV
jgi:hypothetical protein